MNKAVCHAALVALWILCRGNSHAVDEGLVSWWRFDDDRSNSATDSVTGIRDTLIGDFRHVDGVRGKCIRMDGYTTEIHRKGAEAPALADALTIEAWVAPQTYPWNWTPIVNQAQQERPAENNPGSLAPPSVRRRPRLFFGLDAAGHLALKLEIDGALRECVSKEPLLLLKWSHIAGTFDCQHGLALFVNGKLAGELAVKGRLTPSEGGDLILGRNIEEMGPVNSERKASADWPSDMVFDGLVDEVKIFDRALSPDQIARNWSRLRPAQEQPLRWRQMPAGPKALPSRFAAVYCRLRYDELWEEHWRVSDKSDILIHFDKSPVRLVFWRGTSYGGAWVSENGRWMGDQSLERVGQGKSPWGCAEHMSDKQTRYSRVSIIEQNEARIVLHWRYAISDIAYNIFGASSPTDWGEWTDEFYFIYPDAVSTRHQILFTDHLSHEWQETIVLHQPGTRPEDNIDLEAMTLANMKGESKTYSWAGGPPRKFSEPSDINIQMVNLKSRYKPFIIFEPGPAIRPFRGAIHKEYSHFSWWNHWPVAQLPNDGRAATAPDRPSHSSLSQSVENSQVIHKTSDRTFSVVTLIGMSDQPARSLAPLARSWNKPPKLSIGSRGFSGGGYDKNERAFQIETTTPGKPGVLDLTLGACAASPLVNPALVIRNWGDAGVEVEVNGRDLPRGEDVRWGYRDTLEGRDLILWLKIESSKPLELLLTPR